MDFAFINKEARKSSGINIAIIGAGISGLSSAGYLSNAGHSVTVFERLSVAGGLMTYGIPEWRIPLENVQQGVDRLHNEFGVQFEFNTKIVSMSDEEGRSDSSRGGSSRRVAVSDSEPDKHTEYRRFL